MKPVIASLETVSFDEATAFLSHAAGDELLAACEIARARAFLDGSRDEPDEAEIHHALFLMCRARGELPPSFDSMRVELRQRMAA